MLPLCPALAPWPPSFHPRQVLVLITLTLAALLATFIEYTARQAFDQEYAQMESERSFVALTAHEVPATLGLT